MNHIVFCINNNWIKPCGVTIKSILFYNPELDFTFHILGKELSQENKLLLQSVLNEKSALEFHTISDEYDSKFIVREGDYVSIETYYRFFIPDFISKDISKVLYVDADVLCTGSLKDLFETDLTNYACGMILDHSYADIRNYNRLDYSFDEKYFNAGISLINLDFWRKNNVKNQLLDFVSKNPNKCILHDQDAINATLHGKIKRLSFRYNLQNFFFRTPFWATEASSTFFDDERTEKKFWNDILEDLKHPVMIHFNSPYKPWHKECTMPFANLWRKFYTLQYGQKKIKPKPRSLKEKIRFFLIKLAVKLKLKKEIPHILHYPNDYYILENEFIKRI